MQLGLTLISISAKLYFGPSGTDEKTWEFFPLQPRKFWESPDVNRDERVKYTGSEESASTLPVMAFGEKSQAALLSRGVIFYNPL